MTSDPNGIMMSINGVLPSITFNHPLDDTTLNLHVWPQVSGADAGFLSSFRPNVKKPISWVKRGGGPDLSPPDPLLVLGLLCCPHQLKMMI